MEEKDVDWIQLAQDMVQSDSCKHDNKLSDLIKGGKYLDQLSDYQFPKG
jgi:hypothetical protein